ncbi:RDD family protein [Aestuariicella hydrocarbonica]|uniref:RDD family protein n=1 Tax=Pseudomaricurvus hydrocarbonicus TaxID=1470433 RepID=A0A9E5MNN9_9GAMM|nr:RDD family protein [Aestuariicella hydrocarbonica]NHO67537.1 RDD family protein [Aestuariicella hydrocarbonica]
MSSHSPETNTSPRNPGTPSLSTIDTSHAQHDRSNPPQYAGFWIRTAAALIDSLIILAVTMPLLTLVYGREYWLGDLAIQGTWDVLFNYLLPALAVILFWIYRSATPGKMLLKLTIVDAATGGKPRTGQWVGRYFAYYLSILPLMLGFIWVAFDARKQGFHDKLAGTVVIRK